MTTEIEKELYLRFEQEARTLIYPDLRAGYKNHQKMLSTLTNALIKVHKMALEDEDNLVQVSEQSIFDTKEKFDALPVPSYPYGAAYAVCSESDNYGSGMQSYQHSEHMANEIMQRLKDRGDSNVHIEYFDISVGQYVKEKPEHFGLIAE